MATKVEAAMIASAAGIPTVVADAASAATALGGGPAGTYFAAARGRRPATRLLWLKHAAVAHGSLRLDHGAVEAVVKGAPACCRRASPASRAPSTPATRSTSATRTARSSRAAW